MKDWKRTLAALLAAIMLVMPFGATAEPELELNGLPEVDAGLELEIAPEAVGDVTDLELELPDASELDRLDIEDVDLDAVAIEDVVIDGAEAEAGDSVQTNDDDEDDYLIPGLYAYDEYCVDDDDYYYCNDEISETSLKIGEQLKLIIIYTDGHTVTWSSSDGKVATVKDGTVTAIGGGTCTITATLNNGKALECAVTVTDPAELSETELSMEVGSTDELEVYDLGNRTVTWSSSDGKVAMVKGGTVTAIGEGSCTIYATLSNGKVLECEVSVDDHCALYEYESTYWDDDYSEDGTEIHSARLNVSETLRLTVILGNCKSRRGSAKWQQEQAGQRIRRRNGDKSTERRVAQSGRGKSRPKGELRKESGNQSANGLNELRLMQSMSEKDTNELSDTGKE